MKIFKNKPIKPTDPSKKYIKYSILIALGLLVIMLCITAISFLLELEGAEEVKVPEIVAMELDEGILELQRKALVPFIQLVNTPNIEEKGFIIDQEPAAGSMVKAGIRVLLSVSKGPVIDILSDYRGLNIDYVRTEINSLRVGYGIPVTLQEPVTETYDDTPFGTILEQDPLPGAELTLDTMVEFVVSLGPEGEIITVPDLTNLNYMQAIRQGVKNSLPLVFDIVNPPLGDPGGFVIGQNLEPGARVPRYTQLDLQYTKPLELPEEDDRFGIIEANIRIKEVATWIKLEKISRDGDKSLIFSMKHPGGFIRIPIIDKAGTTFAISQEDIELRRTTLPE